MRRLLQLSVYDTRCCCSKESVARCRAKRPRERGTTWKPWNQALTKNVCKVSHQCGKKEVVTMDGGLTITFISVAMFVGCVLLGFIPLLFRFSEVSVFYVPPSWLKVAQEKRVLCHALPFSRKRSHSSSDVSFGCSVTWQNFGGLSVNAPIIISLIGLRSDGSLII